LPSAIAFLFFPAYKSKLLTPEKTNPPLLGRTFLVGWKMGLNLFILYIFDYKLVNIIILAQKTIYLAQSQK
jgi:hypothetical protein